MSQDEEERRPCPNEWVCDGCRRIYHKNPDWTDEKREAEARSRGFDKFPKEDLIRVCTPCFEKAMKRVQ